MTKPGCNDPCPYGSGKKYKQCCLEAEQTEVAGDRSEAVPKAIQWLTTRHSQAVREALAEGFFGGLEGDEYEKRFRSRRVALVRLQVNEHLPAFTEDPRNARNQLLSVINERIRRLCRRSGALILAGVVKGFPHIHALAAQDDRADGDTLVLLHQVRNNEWRLIRSDAAGL